MSPSFVFSTVKMQSEHRSFKLMDVQDAFEWNGASNRLQSTTAKVSNPRRGSEVCRTLLECLSRSTDSQPAPPQKLASLAIIEIPQSVLDCKHRRKSWVSDLSVVCVVTTSTMCPRHHRLGQFTLRFHRNLVWFREIQTLELRGASFQQFGKNLVVELKYPDCTNYEGRKIMVYKNLTISKLLGAKLVDPHFAKGGKFRSPIARFEPTEDGWKLACAIATMIS